jgi:hypothetical protein
MRSMSQTRSDAQGESCPPVLRMRAHCTRQSTASFSDHAVTERNSVGLFCQDENRYQADARAALDGAR